MKFCPYCGADLVDDTASFCAECGKTLPTKTDPKAPPISEKRVKKHKQRKAKKKVGVHIPPSEQAPEEVLQDGYDGYYDDIIPDDNGEIRQALDKALIKKIILLIAGLLVVVGACVAIMYLV